MKQPRARDWSATALLLSLATLSCNAPFPPDARLSLAIQPTSVSVPVGGEQSTAITLTRIGDFTGDVAISVDGLPAGVTAAVSGTSTSGQTTTATITLRASASANVGTFALTVRGSVPRINDATSLLVLTIIESPAYTLALSKPALTIARGGSAPVDAILARTNFTAGVTLSVEDVPGITASFAQNPTTGDSSPATISVGASVAPGTYTVTIRAVSAGIVDRTATLTVTVIPDAIQLLIQSDVSGYQGSTGTTSILVNRGTFAGTVALAAEGVPAGVTASFTPLTPTSASTTITLGVGASVVPGSYTVTVRASGAGVPDATAQLSLNVLPTVFTLILSPQNVTLLQGTSATSTLTIARTAIAVPVDLTVEGAPAGLTITPSPSSAGGTTSAIDITAAQNLTAGQYSVTLRGTPHGLTIASSITTTLGVNVRTTAPGSGNVLLDWSSCVAPSWVAAQDGGGPWIQVAGTSGTYRFDVQSAKGGFTFAEGNNIVVRYMTKAELTAAPLDMCVGALGTKTVNGTGAHHNITESWVYRLGGGSGTSTGAGANFAITGVRNGVHDLIAWGNSLGLGLRGFIRRDVDVADGGSVGTIDLAGQEGFTPAQRMLTVTGLGSGENYGLSVSYLTTAACTVNALYSANNTIFMYGVPDVVQRSNDFHMVTVMATSATSSRVTNEVSHAFTTKTMALPSVLAVPVIATLPGSYKRLEATLGTLASPYNTSVTLRLSDGTRSMSVIATTAYTGTNGVVLAMPDLSGVSGWPSTLAIASGGHGNWTVSANGVSSSASLCTENMRTVLASQSGTF